MKLQTPRGTRDFLPEEMARRRSIFEKIRAVFESYGYGEVWTPAFEDFDLLAKKSGPDIEKEIYVFKDKSGRKLGLRFDPTVPICRIVAADPSIPKPIKFYYITNMWRYDRPQAGRWREFWQAGAELIGTDKPEADAEILSIVCDSLKAIGVTPSFKINSRKIMESLIKEAGIPDDKKFDVFRAIDKLDKVGEDEVKKEMQRYEISDERIDKFLGLVKSGKASKEELKELETIKEIAKSMGVENIEIDFSIVRGIDYYTGFVFETFVKGSEKIGSVASGGRYDTLIGLYSDQDLPATGVGIGIDRLMSILKFKEKYAPATAYIAIVNDSVRNEAIAVVQQLRRKGIKTDFDLKDRSLTKQLEYADRLNIPFAIIIGPEEIKKNKFKLRDMRSKSEDELSLNDIIQRLK